MSNARSATSKVVFGNNSSDKTCQTRPGKSPIRDTTPEGHTQTLDEQGNPILHEEKDRHSEGDRNNKREGHQAAQMNLDEVVKGFLAENKETFLQNLSREQGWLRHGKEDAEVSSKHEAAQRRGSPSLQMLGMRAANNTSIRVGFQIDCARDEPRGVDHRDHREVNRHDHHEFSR